MKLRYLLALAIILVLYGYVSDMDYQDKLRAACDRKGGEMNGDVCVILKGDKK